MTESAKDGKQERCVAFNFCVASSEDITETPLARGRYCARRHRSQAIYQSLNLEKIGVEVDLRRRIVIDDQFNTSVPNIKCIGDVTFGPILAHKAEEEKIAAEEYIYLGYSRMNYETIPSVVYTHLDVACVGKTEQDLKMDGVRYNVYRFPFLTNSRAKMNSSQVLSRGRDRPHPRRAHHQCVVKAAV
jgi:hypothetical protein